MQSPKDSQLYTFINVSRIPLLFTEIRPILIHIDAVPGDTKALCWNNQCFQSVRSRWLWTVIWWVQRGFALASKHRQTCKARIAWTSMVVWVRRASLRLVVFQCSCLFTSTFLRPGSESDSVAHTNTQRCSSPMRLAELRVPTGSVSHVTDTNALSWNLSLHSVRS